MNTAEWHHTRRLKRFAHLQNRPLSEYQVPDLRLIHHHPDFPAMGDTFGVRRELLTWRRMRHDEHPDEYEAAFLAKYRRTLDRDDRDDMEFEDWFNQAPVLTQNSIRERSRLRAAGVEEARLPPVYHPPKVWRVELEGQQGMSFE